MYNLHKWKECINTVKKNYWTQNIQLDRFIKKNLVLKCDMLNFIIKKKRRELHNSVPHLIKLNKIV